MLAVLILLNTHCFSQHIINGKLINHTDSKPIPYANIGIENSPVGTLSNEDGSFQIFVPEKYDGDTILFSALGFKRRHVPVSVLTQALTNEIIMEEEPTILEQVIVSSKKKKIKSYALGNRFTQGGFLYADSISAGAAMALLIDNKYPSYHKDLSYPFTLKKVNIFIDKNSEENFKLRLRFLQRDAISDLPDKDLLKENIIVTSSIKKGWLEFDLLPYRFVASKPFYLVIEWIMEDKDRLALLNEYAEYRKANPAMVTHDSTVVDGKKIGFMSYHHFSPGTHLGVSPNPFSLNNYTCYYRTNSFGEWKRSPVVLTARVEVTP
jgi:hypothetical protein